MSQVTPGSSTRLKIEDTLDAMAQVYSANSVKAVRGQGFIKMLHHHIALELHSRILPKRLNEGVRVVEEASILGAYKAKDVDVAVVHPESGPLVLVGVRSQMSSVGKNVLTYYQDIVGEAVSLQERHPMAVCGYAYLHPLDGTDYARYARLYASISDRNESLHKQIKGIYDEFAYLVVDFKTSPPQLRDDLVSRVVPDVNLSIETFVDRLIERHKKRSVWYDLFS